MFSKSAVLAAVLWLAWVTAAAADPVDDYVRSQLKLRHLPGVSLAVVKDGRIVKAAGYGVASMELDAPATERTVYEVGSISKQFAAKAILLLVEDGKVVVERASGMSYVDFVRTRIFQPLGLESARFKSATEVVPHRADGYLFQDGIYQHGETLRPMIIAANGGVLSNAVDFAKGDIAVTSGKLLRTVRTRLADALRLPGEFTSLGEERLTERHFNLDPAVVRVRWYRAGTASARRASAGGRRGMGRWLRAPAGSGTSFVTRTRTGSTPWAASFRVPLQRRR